MVLFQGSPTNLPIAIRQVYKTHSNMTADQELNAKDVIEIDRRLWRKYGSLALYLASKRVYHLTEKLPDGGGK